VPLLVADIGGTNSRLALASKAGVAPGSVRRFVNRDYRSFRAVVETYLNDAGLSRISRCCIAVAGPVTPERASLTNMDWEISSADLHVFTDNGPVILVNDLVALG